MLESPENPAEPPNSWWNKHKEDILIWTSLGSFVISLLQFFILVIR